MTPWLAFAAGIAVTIVIEFLLWLMCGTLAMCTRGERELEERARLPSDVIRLRDRRRGGAA